MIQFEKLESKYYPEWGFRPHTYMQPMPLTLMMMNGGMGDYITWMTPMRWLMNQATWIDGTIVIPKYFIEFVDYFLKENPRWKRIFYEDIASIPNVNNVAFRGPVELNRESLNATGAHLITCGWVYFTNQESAPEGIDEVTTKKLGVETTWDSYPQFDQRDLDNMVLPDAAKDLEPGKYAIVTCGATTNSRKTPPGAWNFIIEHILDCGLKPVFLGKSVMETGNASNIHTTWGQELRLDLGVDLRDKTSLLQCASIMSRAKFVVGHDNGLLHLAACTRVPIVFGYNLASPKHREPRRPIGKTYNVCLTKEELVCNFCQSNTNFVIGYNFRECFYGDRKCMDMLFDGRAKRWKTQIDLALKEGVAEPMIKTEADFKKESNK